MLAISPDPVNMTILFGDRHAPLTTSIRVTTSPRCTSFTVAFSPSMVSVPFGTILQLREDEPAVVFSMVIIRPVPVAAGRLINVPIVVALHRM